MRALIKALGAMLVGVALTASADTPPARVPHLTVTVNGAEQELPLEKTQLAETKTKPTSLARLASDAAVTQGLQAGISTGISTVGAEVAARMTSPAGSGVVQGAVAGAGGLFSGLLSARSQTQTTDYVWGVPGATSANVLPVAAPVFTVDFAHVLGVIPDDYAPAVVKLTPAQNSCRIVGATEGEADMRSTPAADWQVYSKFMEERVANVQAAKVATGRYRIVTPELAAGEYGVVLRPVSKGKRFTGGDVIRAQGDGLMFDAIWTFRIPDTAQ
jgi:hypothetical protein